MNNYFDEPSIDIVNIFENDVLPAGIIGGEPGVEGSIPGLEE